MKAASAASGESPLPDNSLYIRIGDGDPIPAKGHRFVCQDVVNLGHDFARMTISNEELVQSRSNLLGDFVVSLSDGHIVWSGYVEEAHRTRSGRAVFIRAKGWGHNVRRTHGTLKSQALTPEEFMYNIALAMGIEPQVHGFVSQRRPFKVTRDVRGLRAQSITKFGSSEIGPLFATDEAGLARRLRLTEPDLPGDRRWKSRVVASTITEADYGVPQNRQRLFVIGADDRRPLYHPAATHWGDHEGTLASPLGEPARGGPGGRPGDPGPPLHRSWALA